MCNHCNHSHHRQFLYPGRKVNCHQAVVSVPEGIVQELKVFCPESGFRCVCICWRGVDLLVVLIGFNGTDVSFGSGVGMGVG